MKLEDIKIDFEKRNPSVFWKDAAHCNCFNDDPDEGIGDLPTEIVRIIELAYNAGTLSGLELAEKCVAIPMFSDNLRSEIMKEIEQAKSLISK